MFSWEMPAVWPLYLDTSGLLICFMIFNVNYDHDIRLQRGIDFKSFSRFMLFKSGIFGAAQPALL